MTDDADTLLQTLLDSISDEELGMRHIRSEVDAEWVERSLPAEVSSDREVLHQQFVAALDTIEVQLGERLRILARLCSTWRDGFNVAATAGEDVVSFEQVFDGENLDADRLEAVGESVVALVDRLRTEQELTRGDLNGDAI